MAYTKMYAGHTGPRRLQDHDSVELRTASLDLEWEMERELEEPGQDHYELKSAGHPSIGNLARGGADTDFEPIQPSVSPHGRFERLQEDADFVSHYGSKGQRRSFSCMAKYFLAGAGIFTLGLFIGLVAHSMGKQTAGPISDPKVLDNILNGIRAQEMQMLNREFSYLSGTSELTRARLLLNKWQDLGLKDVQLSNYTVLLSHPGPVSSSIIDVNSSQCFLPNGEGCDPSSPPPNEIQNFSFAAYSAVGSLEAEVVDVQYGSRNDLIDAKALTNVTSKIAVMKLGHEPLLYKLSLLAEAGFGGALLYIDPCDVFNETEIWHQAFGVTLNAGGDPSTPGYPSFDGIYREERANHTPLLVQPISAGMAKEILSTHVMGQGVPCIRIATPAGSARRTIKLNISSQASYRTIHNVIGYLKGKINPDRYVLVGSRHSSWYEGSEADWSGGAAVMTQVIASMMAQTHNGWQPDRTIVFCSWGGSAIGSVGSFEWGEENRVVLENSAVAYINLFKPVRAGRSVFSTASPSLLQLASDIHKRQLKRCDQPEACPAPNVSSVQTPGDVNFFANHLAIPVMEFTSAAAGTVESTSFLSEAFFHTDSSAVEILDPSFKLHESVAKMTAEAILRLSSDPVLPFYPLDIALDVQNKLKDDPLRTSDLLDAAAALRENASLLQSEIMRPANDPKERDPAHVRMLNDVLRDLEKSFLIRNPPPGLYRSIHNECCGIPEFCFSAKMQKQTLDQDRHSQVHVPN
ncbi:inactive N-acetylated-alpha-linked acidic dipeptidase-like protein 2, partial [Denticeps clupeoides]|uniref:inactive N-acetylated-alpha-linked acidic dipeptidase-like protein 2 n=1 Tax=Denticeps clupeoides TaxID=299321 RepID=UPI0010A304F6